MKRYLDAVGIITLIVLVPMALGTLYGYITNSIVGSYGWLLIFTAEPKL